MAIQTPHLRTALTGPLQHLEKIFLDQQLRIESWLREQWLKTPAPLMGSVDLRNAGFKLAPVDTNLFPAGFNNLSADFLPLAVQAAQATLNQFFPRVRRFLLIPENHTRNTYYFESVASLIEILQKAGFEVRVGSLLPDYQTTTIELASGQSLTISPITRVNNHLQTPDYEPCAIILNNDLSDGVPDILKNLEQPIAPHFKLGWSSRLKSHHFSHYQDIAQEFSNFLELDPWLINPFFDNCSDVDFVTRAGETCIAKKVELMLIKIQKKYDEYDIKQRPYVVVKADAGSYGMGVMQVHDAQEIYKLNRKQRVKMASTKGQSISQVILQEGIYTFETVGSDHAVAEPVVYLLGPYVIGGFYRVHTERGIDENLNAPGMHFESLAFASCCNTPDRLKKPHDEPNRFYAYGLIARLALLAAARENTELSST